MPLLHVREHCHKYIGRWMVFLNKVLAMSYQILQCICSTEMVLFMVSTIGYFHSHLICKTWPKYLFTTWVFPTFTRDTRKESVNYIYCVSDGTERFVHRLFVSIYSYIRFIYVCRIFRLTWHKTQINCR